MKNISILLILSLYMSCKKSDDACFQKTVLPNATVTGIDTLGFLKNGTPWVNYGGHYYIDAAPLIFNVRGSYYKYNGEDNFQLSTGRAVKCNSKYIVDDFFYIEIRKGFNHTGNYSLDSSSIRSIHLFDDINKIDYGTDIRHAGILSISKLDTINKIISGTFESILFNIQNLQDSISLTEGRFDLSY
jgi:hypothetical protein